MEDRFGMGLKRRITRRQVIQAGGLAALGLAFHEPIINTIFPRPAFAQYAPPGGVCFSATGTKTTATIDSIEITTITITVCNACKNALSHVTIGILDTGLVKPPLEDGGVYISPAGNHYNVEHATNPFEGVKFEYDDSVGADIEIQDGDCEVFIITTSQVLSEVPFIVSVEAKGGTVEDLLDVSL